VRRSGGLAGLTRQGTADTADLPKAARISAEEALLALPFGRGYPAVSHPDSFRYEVSVENGSNRRSALIDESEVTPALQQLVTMALSSN
jgi:hypothetical protein